jgi:DNA replication protein DnaC
MTTAVKTANAIDSARVELLLSELRLPGLKTIWPKLAAQSDTEGWPAARFLAALAEYEAADRGRRRIERHMAEARLSPQSCPRPKTQSRPATRPCNPKGARERR